MTADGRIKDVSAHVADYDHAFFSGGGLARLRTLSAKADTLPDAPPGVRLGAPVARPRNVFAIGLNYSDHAKETGSPIPDWEVELGIVIGRDTRYLASKDEARDAIAGYCLANDVSEREFQAERGGQWSKGKSHDNFLPLGPWLATCDEVADPQKLSLTLDVNGRRRQTGSTSFMIFGVLHIVHYLSQFLTLEAGDIVITGTPPGVGVGCKPPEFLKPGDVVELSADFLGSQRSVCEQC